LLLISINFTPKTSHSCLKKWYFPIFSRFTQFLIHGFSQHPEAEETITFIPKKVPHLWGCALFSEKFQIMESPRKLRTDLCKQPTTLQQKKRLITLCATEKNNNIMPSVKRSRTSNSSSAGDFSFLEK